MLYSYNITIVFFFQYKFSQVYNYNYSYWLLNKKIFNLIKNQTRKLAKLISNKQSPSFVEKPKKKITN